jgi:hypothetical protein
MLLPPTIEQLDRVKLDLFFVVCNEKLFAGPPCAHRSPATVEYRFSLVSFSLLYLSYA